MINKIIKEPLFHFLLLGVLIYLVSTIWDDKNNQMQEMVVSEGKIRHLKTLYKKTWQREPTQQELENVVQEYTLEQAAYYEGVNLGLDKNDIVIVRRVHQKLDFIAEESRPLPEATDERLSAYLQENSGKFYLDPIIAIRQVYFDPDKHQDIQFEVESTLNKLLVKPDQTVLNLGDSYLFKPRYQKQSLVDLGRIFGEDFAQAIKPLVARKWHGPIRSSYGLHLVYIEEKQDGVLPELEKIRNTVLREWRDSLKKQSTRDYYKKLLERYPVTIHWPVEY